MTEAQTNAPPVEIHGMHINDLFDEAKNFLDGEPIETQGQADAIGELLKRIREARDGADKQRAVEKKPHDEAGKVVQATWKPLLEKCDLASTAAKSALTPWRLKLEAEQRAIAEKARQDADEAAAKLRAAHQTTQPDDLAGQIIRADLEKQAEDAAKAANRAEKVKAPTSGVSMRTYYSAQIIDPLAFGKWAWTYRREEYLELLQTIADRQATGPQFIPGLNIRSEKRAA